MTELFERARAVYQRKTFPGFLRSVARYGKGRAFDCLPHQLRFRLFYRECTFHTDLSPVSVPVPRNSYYTRRAPATYEPHVVECLTDLLNDETVFYDVGSYFGYFTKVALMAGTPQNQVHAFEADSFRTFVLERSCGNTAIHVNQVLIDQREGDGKMTIDSYAKRHTPPDVVKLDIEGMELRALRGSKTTIRERRPTMIVEVHPFSSNYTETALVQYLRECGYELAGAYHQMNRTDKQRPLQWIPEDTVPSACLGDERARAENQPYVLFAVSERYVLDGLFNRQENT